MNKTTFASQAKTVSLMPPTHGVLQRKCACGNHTMAGGECDECNKIKQPLQLAVFSTDNRRTESEEGKTPPIVHEVLHSPGQPLDPVNQAFMSSRFGYDFSQVRVHTDAKAAQSARAVNASAFTVGRHIVFRNGQYEPWTTQGRSLLAHELTHVVQQRSLTPNRNVAKEPGSGGLEQAAGRAAASVVSGQPVGDVGRAVAANIQCNDHGEAAEARPCMIKFKINIGQRDQVSFDSLLGGRPDLRTGY